MGDARMKQVAGVVLEEIVSPETHSRQPQVSIGLFLGDDEFPVKVLEEPVPSNFPKKLLFHLADYMARGFNGAIRETALIRKLSAKPVGRPIDPEVQRIGREAAKLREQGFTYGEIARKLCSRKVQPLHRCDKKCADRIQKAARPYVSQGPI
jgi:hypothetical protein